MSPIASLEAGESLSFDIAWELDLLSGSSAEARTDEAVGMLTGGSSGVRVPD
jgi:hypothetical protein